MESGAVNVTADTGTVTMKLTSMPSAGLSGIRNTREGTASWLEDSRTSLGRALVMP